MEHYLFRCIYLIDHLIHVKRNQQILTAAHRENLCYGMGVDITIIKH